MSSAQASCSGCTVPLSNLLESWEGFLVVEESLDALLEKWGFLCKVSVIMHDTEHLDLREELNNSKWEQTTYRYNLGVRHRVWGVEPPSYHPIPPPQTKSIIFNSISPPTTFKTVSTNPEPSVFSASIHLCSFDWDGWVRVRYTRYIKICTGRKKEHQGVTKLMTVPA